MSEIKVNSIKGVNSTDAAITINNSDGTCTANLTNKPNRNLIINGSQIIAQRGVSSTSSGYQTVDRFKISFSGTDEAPTQAQVDVASGTTPYTSGFRKSLKLTNGNQTSGAGAADYMHIVTALESQDIANSGWNYVSSSSFISLSFWVKSSVAQNFYGYLRSQDGTSQKYVFETGSLTADTWTKVTKTISGNSNLTFNNDNEEGLEILIAPFWGTDYTDSGVGLNAWAAHSGSTRTPDYTSTWYTTNDATFEITGVQLEVSDHASDFQFRSFAQELALCQRYYYRITPLANGYYGVGNVDQSNNGQILIIFPTKMRVKPSSLETTGTASDYVFRVTNNVTCTSVPAIDNTAPDSALIRITATGHGLTDKSGAFLRAGSDNSFLAFSSEL